MSRGRPPKMKCLLPLGSVAACHPACRCEECRRVRKDRKARTVTNYQARVKAGELAIIHGSPSAYNYAGCRCRECLAAVLDRQRVRLAHNRGQQ